jgi:uncharacterized UPF0160 family protein
MNAVSRLFHGRVSWRGLTSRYFSASYKIEPKKVVLTHDGVFHADDAMACTLLTRFCSRFRGASVVRSRDQAAIQAADAVVDVGGVYSPETFRYDHHQRGFSKTFSNKFDIRLSSAGLVYLHHGREVILDAIEKLLQQSRLPSWLKKQDIGSSIEELFVQLYESFFLTMDAIDNGVSSVDQSVSKRYEPFKTDLIHRIQRLNTPWWSTSSSEDSARKFELAMSLCEEEFLSELLFAVMATVGSEQTIIKALTNNAIQDGKIILLDKPCSWKATIMNVEKKLGMDNRTKFVVFKESQGSSYRVQGVPIHPGSFKTRGSLRSEWRGLSKTELAQVTGIGDVIFVHASGFIGGAQSQKSAIRLATLSLLN